MKLPSLKMYGLTLLGTVIVCAAYEAIQEAYHLHVQPMPLPLPDYLYEMFHGMAGALVGVIVSYPLAFVIARWQSRIEATHK